VGVGVGVAVGVRRGVGVAVEVGVEVGEAVVVVGVAVMLGTPIGVTRPLPSSKGSEHELKATSRTMTQASAMTAGMMMRIGLAGAR